MHSPVNGAAGALKKWLLASRIAGAELLVAMSTKSRRSTSVAVILCLPASPGERVREPPARQRLIHQACFG